MKEAILMNPRLYLIAGALCFLLAVYDFLQGDGLITWLFGKITNVWLPDIYGSIIFSLLGIISIVTYRINPTGLIDKILKIVLIMIPIIISLLLLTSMLMMMGWTN